MGTCKVEAKITVPPTRSRVNGLSAAGGFNRTLVLDQGGVVVATSSSGSRVS
jgi:hypothetical protein